MQDASKPDAPKPEPKEKSKDPSSRTDRSDRERPLRTRDSGSTSSSDRFRGEVLGRCRAEVGGISYGLDVAKGNIRAEGVSVEPLMDSTLSLSDSKTPFIGCDVGVAATYEALNVPKGDISVSACVSVSAFDGRIGASTDKCLEWNGPDGIISVRAETYITVGIGAPGVSFGVRPGAGVRLDRVKP